MPACTFFGHHDAPNSLETKLLEIIKEAIDQYGVRTFYVGCIPWRNKWMISQCEYVISYVSYTSGQAAKYVKIAKEQGKHILSLGCI